MARELAPSKSCARAPDDPRLPRPSGPQCADIPNDSGNLSRAHLKNHDINVGFDDFVPILVDRVNGVVPRDMAHLVDLIESSADWVEITAQSNALMVLDARRARAANQEILHRYRIERDRSPDLPSPTDPSVG